MSTSVHRRNRQNPFGRRSRAALNASQLRHVSLSTAFERSRQHGSQGTSRLQLLQQSLSQYGRAARKSPQRGQAWAQWHCGLTGVVSKQTCFLQDLRSYFGGGSAPKVTPKAEPAAKPAATGEAAGGARSCMLESILFLAGVRVVCADRTIVQVPLSSARPRPQCVPLLPVRERCNCVLRTSLHVQKQAVVSLFMPSA